MIVEPDNLLEVAREAAFLASSMVTEFLDAGRPTVESKSTPSDYVTVADRSIESAIRKLIQTRFSHHEFLGEESGSTDAESGYRWIVDPIDGTVNFVHGLPHYAVSIAVEVDGVTEVGVVLDLARGELFSAVRLRGATINDVELRCPDDCASIGLAVVGTGFAYQAERRRTQAEQLAHMLPAIADIRRSGSAALDICWVAAGRLDGYFESGINRWDSAAGELIASEAGAVVSWKGRALVVAKPSVSAPLAELVKG